MNPFRLSASFGEFVGLLCKIMICFFNPVKVDSFAVARDNEMHEAT